MAVSNKTIIALALLAIAVAVVAESQGTMRPGCVVGVRGVQCGAQLSLCVCGDHWHWNPSYPLSSLSGTRGHAARSPRAHEWPPLSPTSRHPYRAAAA